MNSSEEQLESIIKVETECFEDEHIGYNCEITNLQLKYVSVEFICLHLVIFIYFNIQQNSNIFVTEQLRKLERWKESGTFKIEVSKKNCTWGLPSELSSEILHSLWVQTMFKIFSKEMLANGSQQRSSCGKEGIFMQNLQLQDLAPWKSEKAHAKN